MNLRLLWLALLPLLGSAQWTNPYTSRSFNNPVSSSIDTLLMHSMQRNMLLRRIEETRRTAAGEARPAAAPVVPAAPLSATDFRPPAKRQLPDMLAEQTPGATAEQKAALKQLYHGVMDAFEKEARKNNLAYAFAMLLGGALQVWTGKEIPDAESEKLAQDLNNLLASDGGLAKLSPAEKQKMYEAFIITGGSILAFWQMGAESNDDTLKNSAKDLAKFVLEKAGLTL